MLLPLVPVIPGGACQHCCELLALSFSLIVNNTQLAWCHWSNNKSLPSLLLGAGSPASLLEPDDELPCLADLR